jgi:hypothetical protein
MKTGFQIEIQNGLSPDQLSKAITFADSFIIKTLQDPRKRYWGCKTGRRCGPFTRGGVMTLDKDLFFLRINRKRRVFGIVTSNSIDRSKGYGKYRFIKTEMNVYAKVGDVKG